MPSDARWWPPSPSDLLELAELAESCESAEEGEEWIQQRCAFYRRLYAIGNGVRVVDTIMTLRAEVSRYLLEKRFCPGWHRELLENLATADTEGAARFLEDHLMEVLESMEEEISVVDRWNKAIDGTKEMKEEQVVFYRGGERVVGDLYLPEAGKGEPRPAVVQGTGLDGFAHRPALSSLSRGFPGGGNRGPRHSTTEGAGTPMATRWGSRPADNWRISPTP